MVGISTKTPKLDGISNPLVCKKLFPSTKITWGIHSGLFFFNSFIKSTLGFTSLNAKNEGIYGSSIFINF